MGSPFKRALLMIYYSPWDFIPSLKILIKVYVKRRLWFLPVEQILTLEKDPFLCAFFSSIYI